MTPDYSKERDAAAKSTATERSEKADFDANELADMVHALKAELASNTTSTREIADRQKETAEIIQDMQSEIAKVDFGKLAQMVEALETMKGGVKVLGWLERPAKWLAAMLGLGAAIWAIWNGQGGGK